MRVRKEKQEQIYTQAHNIVVAKTILNRYK